MFQQHLAIFHKSRPSAGVVLTPTTNSFYRNYQDWGEGKMGGEQKIIWGEGAFAPPPADRSKLDILFLMRE